MPPHLPKRVLNIADETRCIHEWRGLQAIAERRTKLTEAWQIACQGRGNLHELLGSVRDELWQPKICELTKAAAADGGLSRERNDGNTHPKCVEARGVTVGRKSVETNVDLLVEPKVIL